MVVHKTILDFAVTHPQVGFYAFFILVFTVLLANSAVHSLFGIQLARKTLPLILLNLAYCGGVLVTLSGLVTNASAVLILSLNGFLGGMTFWTYSRALSYYFSLNERAFFWSQRLLLTCSVLSLVVAFIAGIMPEAVVSPQSSLFGSNEISTALFVGLQPSIWTMIPVLLLMMLTAWSIVAIVFTVWRFRDREPILFLGIVFSLFAMINDIGIGMGALSSKWLLMPVSYFFEILRFQWVMVAQAHRKIASLNREIEYSRNAQNNFALIRLLGHDLRRAIRRMRDEPSEIKHHQIVEQLTGLIEESSLTPALREEIPLQSLFDEVISSHRSEINKLNVEIQISCAKEVCIHGYRNDLYFAFSNLVLNSIEALKNEPSRQISISAVSKEDHVRVDLTDSGFGFSPKARENLFELPKVELGSSRRGVGLIVVQELLKRSSGFITLDSGPSTRFIMKFY